MAATLDQLSYHVRSVVKSLCGGKLTTGPLGKLGAQGDDVAVSKTWSVAIQVDRAHVALPATIDCYLGDVQVGRRACLAAPATGVAHAVIPLNRFLSVNEVDLGDQNAVAAYLVQAMRFEMLQVTSGVTPSFLRPRCLFFPPSTHLCVFPIPLSSCLLKRIFRALHAFPAQTPAPFK